MSRFVFLLLAALLVVALAAPSLAQDDEFVFGMVLLGPEDDHGWSQAHFEAGEYVQEHLPGARMIVYPNLNATTSPQVTLMQVVTDMIDQGATLIFTTSDAFEEDTNAVAEAFPDISFVNVGGDDALTGDAPPNVSNVMGQMEWAKLIAGCAAGLATQTGRIGYVGSLINNETRRLAASTFLGARYCYQRYSGGSLENFTFTVTWIGYWFNVPGDTLDPNEVVNAFYDGGADVVISGIDTSEAITIAAQREQRGELVWAVPYDYRDACAQGPDVCLGTPYFNWGPSYLNIVQSALNGTWEQSWMWPPPDWNDINNAETSPVGFAKGEALTESQNASLDDFISTLASYATNPMTPENEFGIKSIALWTGPLNLQNGTELAAPGQVVDPLDVWYLDQLLEGMTGESENQ